MLKESILAPKTVHADAGNAGRDMSLMDVAAAGCDIIPSSKHSDVTATRSAGVKHGVDTSASQMMAYARHLGMNLIQDLDLLWIAEQALNAPIPDGWTENFAEDGTVYYSNHKTGLTTHSHPLDEYYRKLYKRSLEVKLLSSKDLRKESQTKKPLTENLAVKVIESLTNVEESDDRVNEERMNEIHEDLEAERKREEKTRTFGTDLGANNASNQTIIITTAAKKEDALASAACTTNRSLWASLGFKNKASTQEKENKENGQYQARQFDDRFERRQRCVIPASAIRSAPVPQPQTEKSEEVDAEVKESAKVGTQCQPRQFDDRFERRERCVIPASTIRSAPVPQPQTEKSEEVDAEAEELAKVIKLSAEEAEQSRLQREADDEAESVALQEALKLSEDLAEAMKLSEVQAAEEQAQIEAEKAAEAEIIRLSLEEEEARRHREAFEFDEEQRAIARAVLESAIAEQKAEAARKAEEERLAAEKAEKARIAAEEAEKARIAAEKEKALRLEMEAKEAAEEAEAMRLSAEEAERARAVLEEEAAQEAQAIKLSMEEADVQRQRDEEYQAAIAKAVKASIEAEVKAEAARKAQELRVRAAEEERARVAAEKAEKARIAAEEAEKARVAEAKERWDRINSEKANAARRARRALELQQAEAEAKAIKLSIAEATAEETARAKLAAEEEDAVTRATVASLNEQRVMNDKKAKELVPSLLFAGMC